MNNSKDNYRNIIWVVVALLFFYVLFLIFQKEPKEDKKAALRDKLLKDKGRARRKIDVLLNKQQFVKRDHARLAAIGKEVSLEAKKFAIFMLLLISVLTLSAVVYAVYVLSSGNKAVVITLTTLSILGAIKYLSDVITAILRLRKISLREIGDYFEQKRLKKLYEKYHYEPKNLNALIGESQSIDDQIKLLELEIKMIDSSLKELNEG